MSLFHFVWDHLCLWNTKSVNETGIQRSQTSKIHFGRWAHLLHGQVTVPVRLGEWGSQLQSDCAEWECAITDCQEGHSSSLLSWRGSGQRLPLHHSLHFVNSGRLLQNMSLRCRSSSGITHKSNFLLWLQKKKKNYKKNYNILDTLNYNVSSSMSSFLFVAITTCDSNELYKIALVFLYPSLG